MMKLFLVLLLLGTAGFPAVSFGSTPWPPRAVGKFPDLTVVDGNGSSKNLSAVLAGRKAGLIEFVSITCPACHAFAGAGGGKTPMPGFSAQPGLPSLEQLIQEFGKISPRDSGFGIVLLVLFNKKNEPAIARDLAEFSAHYGLNERGNVSVVAAPAELTKKSNVDAVPAFYLVDPKDLRIVKHAAKNDGGFYTSLLPELGKMAKGD